MKTAHQSKGHGLPAIDVADAPLPLPKRQPFVDARLLASYQLRLGVGVSEQPFDTLPGALQEELLAVQSRARRSWLDDKEINPFTGRRAEAP